MSNYKHTVQVTPGTNRVVRALMRAVVEELKVPEVEWEKNTGKLTFQFDAQAFENQTSAQDGDPLMVQRIKAAEAELRKAMEAAAAVGLNVQWVSVGADGRRQILPEPTVIITRTY